MARVRSFERGTQSVKAHPTEADCFHQEVTLPNGERLLHLSTFGSENRQSQPKSSQSLQLDEEACRALLTIIRETFPGIR